MADAVLCVYLRTMPRCRDVAVGEIPKTWAHEAWPLCETHIQPSEHPPDLRDKLVRYETAGAAGDGAHPA